MKDMKLSMAKTTIMDITELQESTRMINPKQTAKYELASSVKMNSDPLARDKDFLEPKILPIGNWSHSLAFPWVKLHLTKFHKMITIQMIQSISPIAMVIKERGE